MTPGELIENAKLIRQRLRYPPNSVPDRGIDLTRKSTAYKGDIPPPDTPPKKTLAVMEPEAPRQEVRFPIHFGDIVDAVSSYYHLSKDDLVSCQRHAPFVKARRVIIYISSRFLKNRTLSAIARELKKDHTTILHAQKKIIDEISWNPELVEQIKQIEANIVLNYNRLNLPTLSEFGVEIKWLEGGQEQKIQSLDQGVLGDVAAPEALGQGEEDQGCL